MPLILASASPRRAELLSRAGFTFEVRPVEVDERRQHGEPPEQYVRRLAAAKARALAETYPRAAVLGADTAVVLDDLVLLKPADDEEAAGMLRMLSGRWHEVLTGVAARQGGRQAVGVERTAVHFVGLSPSDIAWYIASGEPRDKAGAYAVQGLASRFVDRIEGSYSNVVGLPIALVCHLLRQVGAAEVAAAADI